MPVAVLADIVGSRRLPDRVTAQRDLDAAIERVESARPSATLPLRPTVGDEQQGLYATLDEALTSLVLLQLALPDGLECRFGIGVGEVDVIPATGGEIPEGPGWWAAREAIDIVRALQKRTSPSARTWIVRASGEDAQMAQVIRTANSYLLVRDHLVGAMSARERRLVYGRCLGATQSELARSEGITQPAVSQALAGSGASSLIEGFRLLTAGAGT